MARHLGLEDARAEVGRLREEGWTLLPCDDPARGSLGAVAFRDRPDGTEEQVLVEWLPWGELETEERVAADVEEFEAMLDSLRKEGMAPKMGHTRAPLVVPCDDPVRRMVGFAAYSGGKARVVRCPLTAARAGLSEELRTEIAALQHARLNSLLSP